MPRQEVSIPNKKVLIMLLNGTPNAPRFSSAASMAGSNYYYLNWLEKQKKEKEALAQQQAATTAPLPQFQKPLTHDRFQPQPVRFKGDPLTWTWLGITALSHGVGKAIDWLIKQVKDAPQPLLTEFPTPIQKQREPLFWTCLRSK
jgi:hypothetical protein